MTEDGHWTLPEEEEEEDCWKILPETLLNSVSNELLPFIVRTKSG
jgi:hypothetical protein